MKELSSKQNIEIEYWRNSEHESPEANSIHNIVNKMTDAEVFLDCLNRYHEHLVNIGKVLEMGAGQGWASCIYKLTFPNTHVTATDISEFAIASINKWERLLETNIDNYYSCKSYETNEANNSINLIFSFAAAHHFLAHNRTLKEINRILKPNGKAIYFHEPATPRYLYRIAYWRVNRKRPQVPEDVLITSEIRKLAIQNGLHLQVDYYPSLMKRGAFETLYFFILGRIPVLQKILPCSAIFIFTKKPIE